MNGASISSASSFRSNGDMTMATAPSKQSAQMAYTLIIIGIVLVSLILTLWLYLRHRKRHSNLPPAQSPDSKPSNTLQSTLFKGLRGWTMLSEGKFKQPKDAEKGLAVHVTPPKPRVSTQPPKAPSRFPYPAAIAPASQRRTFEDMWNMRRASHKTILCELEGDAGPVPAMPSISREFHAAILADNNTTRKQVTSRINPSGKAIKQQVVVSEREKEVVLSEGKQGRFVKGREVAAIVAIYRKHERLPSAPNVRPTLPLSRSLDDARVVELADDVFLREMSVAIQTMDSADREDRARKQRRRRKREERSRRVEGNVTEAVNVEEADGLEAGEATEDPFPPPLSALGVHRSLRPSSI